MMDDDMHDEQDGSEGFAEFLRAMTSGGKGGDMSGMLEMAKQAKLQMTERLLNDTVEGMDTNYLVGLLKNSRCEMSLDSPAFLSPGDILVRLTDEEIAAAKLNKFPYRYPRPGQPIEVVKVIADPLPNSSGSIEDFVAKVNLYEVDCDNCPQHGKSHDDDPDCIIRVRDTIPYTMNSRYFKFYHG